MRKFTPGKWKIDMSSFVSYDCPHTFIYPEDLKVRQIDEDVHIALVNCNYDEWAANARLIAAAPEMYGELYEALQLCEGKSSYDGDEFASQAKSIRELLARIDRPADVET